MANRLDRVPLILNHPPLITEEKTGKKVPAPIQEKDVLGTISYKYDRKIAKLVGEAYYYDECFHRLPKHLQDKVYRHENMPISQGFGFTLKDEHILTDMLSHHLAVLTDEKPLCPLDRCGVNVRMESDSTMTNFRYEQRTEAEDLDRPNPPPKAEPYDSVGLGVMIGELKAEVAQLRKQLEETKEPVPQKQEVATPEQQADAEPPEASQQETPRATQRILPAGETPKEEELKHDRFGRIILS